MVVVVSVITYMRVISEARGKGNVAWSACTALHS